MTCRRGIINVMSPSPCSEIKANEGNVVISLKMSERLPLTVCSVKWDGERYTDTVIKKIEIDADEVVELDFPAHEYPHGPITIRFTAGELQKPVDIYHLQLYNHAGAKHCEGIGAFDTPYGARGMSLVYEDDFNRLPDISATRTDAEYYSHKPGGGDFSQLPFSDYESEKNPFFHTDTYLRIRADWAKRSAGLISSVKSDGSGFSVKAPCYFECRFLAPNAIGSWPAFWLLTNHVKQGGNVPVDELDTIEAYGLEDLEHQNQTGYYVTSHRWNQGKHETIDPSNFMDMRSLGNELGWDACFHTYGTRITEEETVYTCDDIPVFSHPTQPVSKYCEFYFMLNLAVGGNGWPVDLSRYGQIELYADFIRVYAG